MLNWPELLKHPGHDHLVQVYRDRAFLAEAVTHYIAAGLKLGESAIIIARPENRRLFSRGLGEHRPVRMLDADETLATFMVGGMPEWGAFQRVCGGEHAQRAVGNIQLNRPGHLCFRFRRGIDGHGDAVLALLAVGVTMQHGSAFVCGEVGVRGTNQSACDITDRRSELVMKETGYTFIVGYVTARDLAVAKGKGPSTYVVAVVATHGAEMKWRH